MGSTVDGVVQKAESRRRIGPVVPIAILGVIVVAYNIWLYGSWITGPDFVTNTVGRDTAPLWVRNVIFYAQVLSVLVFLATQWFFVLRPWIRTREFPYSGIFIFGVLTVGWQNNLVNYTTLACLENTLAVNFGNWTNYVPGLITPNMEKFPEMMLMWFLSFGSWFALLPVLLGCKVINAIKLRRPGLSNTEVILIAYAFFALLDFMLEATMVRFHFYMFYYTVRSFTLWPGEIHQFPLYEPVFWSIMWTGLFSLYYFRDDKGYSWAERGIVNLKLGKTGEKWLRFFVIAAVANVLIATYEAGFNIVQLSADSVARDVPDYLKAGLCGDDQAFVCPSAEAPFGRRTGYTNRLISREEVDKITKK